MIYPVQGVARRNQYSKLTLSAEYQICLGRASFLLNFLAEALSVPWSLSIFLKIWACNHFRNMFALAHTPGTAAESQQDCLYGRSGVDEKIHRAG